MNDISHGTLQKALTINLDKPVYGTIAEIGAGQQIANWFFRAGGAAGTIAKTMSAYDMTFSDEIYGKASRYVSQQRTQAMLEHEFSILRERLDEKRGETTTFFALADTVKARSFKDNGDSECQGWMGIRFQHAAQSDTNDVMIHVRLLDDTNAEQSEALGILGVNLIAAAFYQRADLNTFLLGLMDDLSRKRVEIDLIQFRGSVFSTNEFDDRMCALSLVENDLADAALFDAEGEIVQPSDKLYGKPVLLKRGSFDPVTKLHIEMTRCGREAFAEDHGREADGVIEIFELTMNNLLTTSGVVDKVDFLARCSVLQSLGKYVLVSKYARFFRLSEYLNRHTKAPVGIVLGTALFEKLFDDKWYEGMKGGLLEAFGKLLCNGIRLYVYPSYDAKTGLTRNAANAILSEENRYFLEYLIHAGHIRLVTQGDAQLSRTNSQTIREMWQSGNAKWKTLVPPEVLENGRWQ